MLTELDFTGTQKRILALRRDANGQIPYLQDDFSPGDLVRDTMSAYDSPEESEEEISGADFDAAAVPIHAAQLAMDSDAANTACDLSLGSSHLLPVEPAVTTNTRRLGWSRRIACPTENDRPDQSPAGKRRARLYRLVHGGLPAAFRSLVRALAARVRAAQCVL